MGKTKRSETNKNASSESLSTTPRDDDVNDEEQHERTKMKEQNQLSFSVAKAEMGEKTQPWTKQEDLKLQHMQEKYGNKWPRSRRSYRRTGQQCAQRWRHRVNPNIRREKWTKEEDEKVILMMFVLSFSRFKNHHHLSRESREIPAVRATKTRDANVGAPRRVETSVLLCLLLLRSRSSQPSVLLLFTLCNKKNNHLFFSRCHREKSERGDERRLRSSSRSSQRNKKRHLGGLLLFLTKNFKFFFFF